MPVRAVRGATQVAVDDKEQVLAATRELICAQEMAVAGSMPRVIRLLAHIETTRPAGQVRNVYLNGTELLRVDVPAIPQVEG